jgi:hypothetical protein
MSLDEWLSINPGINCNALLPGSVVCSAQGNATLPEVPSGTNPTAGMVPFLLELKLFDNPLHPKFHGAELTTSSNSAVRSIQSLPISSHPCALAKTDARIIVLVILVSRCLLRLLHRQRPSLLVNPQDQHYHLLPVQTARVPNVAQR